MRTLLAASVLTALAWTVLACGDNGPGDMPYVGTYSLQSVEGSSLPVAVIITYSGGSKDTTVITNGSLTLRTDGGFSFSDTWMYFGFGSQESGSSTCQGEYVVESDGDFHTDGAVTCNDETEIDRVYGTWSSNRLDLTIDFVDLGLIDAVFTR